VIREKVVEPQKKEQKYYKYGDPDDYQLQQAVAYLKKGASAAESQASKPEAQRIKERVEKITNK